MSKAPPRRRAAGRSLQAVAALGLLLAAFARRSQQRAVFTKVRKILGTTRAQIGLVVVLAILLQLPMAPDLILRWNVRQGVIAIAFGVALALVVWAFARRLTLPRTGRPHAPARVPFPPKVMALVGQACSQAVVMVPSAR